MMINERIKMLRTNHNLTLLEVAEFLGVKEATAQRYESGAIKNIPYETIEKLSLLFRCTPSYLMGWDENPKSSSDVSDEDKNLLTLYHAATPEAQAAAVMVLKSNPRSLSADEMAM